MGAVKQSLFLGLLFVPKRSLVFFRSGAQPGNVIKSQCDEFLTQRIVCLSCGGQNLDKILQSCSNLGPGPARSFEKQLFKFFLPVLQRFLICLEFLQMLTSDFSFFSGRRVTMLIKLDRIFSHDLIPFLRLGSP